MLGETVGNYRIVRQIGEGGMGRVYLAEHPLIGKRAAIKVLLPQYSANADIVARFFNEARSIALLKHPGVVDVYDFGHLPNGAAFIVMEHLEGESLSARLQREDRLASGALVALSRQVASTLAAAHAKGVVHRDLKPDNIYLVADGSGAGVRAKILDFGIAKLVSEPVTHGKTRTGALMGTPTYMSPEQCRGAGQVDHRSDIYSLGCVMYEMASGAPPFVGEGPGDVMSAHLFDEPRALGNDVPVGLRMTIATAMAKPLDKRFQTMTELADALDRTALAASGRSRQESLATVRLAVPAVEPRRGSTHPSGTVLGSFSTTLGSAAGELPSITPAGRRRSGWLLGFVGVGVAIAATAGGIVVRGGKLTATAPGERGGKAPPLEPTAADSKAPPPEPRRQIELSLTTQPSGADIFRVADGVRVGKTPWHSELAPAPGDAVFIVRMKGYRDEQVIFPLFQNDDQSLTLTRVRRAPAAPRAASPPQSRPASIRDGVVDPFADQ